MKFLYLLLFVFPVGIMAQDTTKSPQKKWSVGIVASPDYCYRILTDDGSYSAKAIVNSRNEYEIPKFGITTGIHACYVLKNRFSLEIGTDYSNRGYETNHYTGFIASMPNDPSIPEKVTYKNSYHCVAVPVLANFVMGEKRFRFIAGAGLITNVLIERRVTQTLIFANDNTVVSNYKSQTGFSSLNLALQLSAGTEAVLTRKIYLRLQPVFRFDSGLFQTSPIKEHLWSVGINVGLFFRL